jgi:hypothetical protein
MRQVDTDRTRVFSPRQLPTDHDYAGGQSCSIREYQSDQPSSKAASTFARNASLSYFFLLAGTSGGEKAHFNGQLPQEEAGSHPLG